MNALISVILAAGKRVNKSFSSSFLLDQTNVTVSVAGGFTKLRDLVNDQLITGQAARGGRGRAMGGGQGPSQVTFSLTLKPHSYLAFAAEK